MKKIKELFKNKKFLICFIVCVVLICLMIIFLIINRETKELKEEAYTTYLINGSNTILKLEFVESYYECQKGRSTAICGDINRNVTNFEVLIDLDVNLKDMDIQDALVAFINEIIENNGEIAELIITSDYDFNEEFIDEIKKNIDNNINIYVNYEKEIDNIENVTYYTINFDTAGGSSIDSIVVKENDTITKPNDPTKEGYEFNGWYLNDAEYDFATKVTEDITLIAKWEEKETASSAGSTTNRPNQTTNKINLNNNISATIYTESTGSQSCFFYIYSDNIQNLYPKFEYENWSNGTFKVNLCPGPREDALDTEIVLDDLNNSNLVYNTNKEKALESAFSKLNGTPGFIVDNFNNDNHKISFEYRYITFNGLNVDDGTNANKEITNLLNGSYLIYGPCGGFDNLENVTVNETICEEFNLDCGRW